jgi:hypothetical protein
MLVNRQAKPVHTEVSPHDDRGLEIDTIQYRTRDFGFWTGTQLKRTVSRHYDLGVRDSDPLWPFEDKRELLEPTKDEESHVLDLPAVFKPRTVGEQSVNTLQEWECVVIDSNAESVTAMARSLLIREEDQQYIQIPIQEFPPEERDRLERGVVFRLIVGFVRKPSGSRIRESIIYLRHQLPKRDRPIEGLLEFLSAEDESDGAAGG